MKKVTSALIVAFSTAVCAGSAIAATPASHTDHKASTHQVHKQHQTQKSVVKKAEDKAPTAK